MMNTLRAFIAIEMPTPVVDIVRQSQEVLRRGGVHLRWVRPENVHLTLRFLGDISTEAIDGIRFALERLAMEIQSFSLRIKGAGVFPGASRPRVLWLGFEEQIHLLEIYGKLSSLLSEQGIPEEKRPFKGHLTIGRAKGRVDTNRLRVKLAELEGIESQPFAADRVCLFKSDLKPGGAVYTPLVRVRTGRGNCI
jgi:2'-5' RNA ligase